MAHFYDHWVGNKDSVRPKAFEAIVDTFARRHKDQLRLIPGHVRSRVGPVGPCTRRPDKHPHRGEVGRTEPREACVLGGRYRGDVPQPGFPLCAGRRHFVPFKAPEETVSRPTGSLS